LVVACKEFRGPPRAVATVVLSSSSRQRLRQGSRGDGERAVLRLAGEFDLSNVGAAQESLTKALGQSRSGSVVVDMRELTFIDSTGIAFLLRAIQEHGRSLTIRESETRAVRRLLGLMGIPDLALGAGTSIGGR
jgi:anti-anti-sigma factor